MPNIENYQFNTLSSRFEGNTLVLKFNRTKVLNAINAEMEIEFYTALKKAELDDDVKVVLLMGEGRVFSSGHDYNAVAYEMNHPDEEPPLINGRPWMRTGRILPPWEFSKPLVGAVHNFVGPHAVAILMTFDVLIAAEGTKFSHEAVRNNFSGVPFGPYNMLPFHFPINVVKAWWLQAGWFDAEQGLQMNFLRRVVPFEDLEGEALRYCHHLEPMSGPHYQAAKKGIHQMYELWGLLQMETLGRDPYQPEGADLEKFEEFVRMISTEGASANARKRDEGVDKSLSKV